jgi:hypothetical protein
MGLNDILNTAAVVLRNVNDAAIINNWLQMADQGAYDAITAQVASSPTDAVDRLDSALLSAAASAVDRATRLRLTKFYAMFKIAEVVRYEQFRGFPS